MQQDPSLLDWLRVKLGHPRNQRILRFGSAGLAALWGAYSLLFLGKQGLGGYFFLGLALGLLFWGLSVRGQGVAGPDMPGLSMGPGRGAAAAPGRPGAPAVALPTTRETYTQLLAGLRLPSAILLTIAG